MAGLPWPPLNRLGSTSRPMGSSDSDMIDDIGHETFAPPAPTTLPDATPTPSPNPILPPSTTPYNHHQDYTTMEAGHRVLHHFGNYPHPLTIGNVQYTPFSSRSGTRTVLLALCISRRSTNKGWFVNLIRNISFTSLLEIKHKPIKCQIIGALTTVSLCFTKVLHTILHGYPRLRILHQAH